MNPHIPEEFYELLNRYPSPHNGQPITITPRADGRFTMAFVRERGLSATPISYRFSFVSMGVFVKYAVQAARAYGFDATFDMALPKGSDLAGTGPVSFGILALSPSARLADTALRDVLAGRRTSRRTYTEGVDENMADSLRRDAEGRGMTLIRLDTARSRKAIWLNQRAVFDDLDDSAVRLELDHWLRYSKTQKERTRDGLSYDCMELNGILLKFVVRHPGLLKNRFIMKSLEKYYTRTMTDAGDVFYLVSPFDNEQGAFMTGVGVMSMWTLLEAGGYSIHPFGTIVSNVKAHADFLELAGMTDESAANYVTFIFRAGRSDTPHESLRLPYKEHLLGGAV